MGGFGSTRWGSCWKMRTVEDCLRLDISEMRRAGFLQPGWRSGIWRWRNSVTKEAYASVSYVVNMTEHSPGVHLEYRVTARDGTKRELAYAISLQSSSCHFGGKRWWFTCPLLTDGQPCRRRVRVLYLPPGSDYFGCRHCHQLTYRSSQQSDKRVQDLKKLGPLGILRAVRAGEADLWLGLKALPDDIWKP